MKPAIAATALLLALSLTACGEDTPPVCSSVDNLKASVADVKKVDVSSSGALAELQSGLKTVTSDFAKVKTDAKSEFSSQLDAVETSLATLKASVQAATTGPSGATLTAAGSALRTFGTNVQTLITDVESTC